MYEHNYSSWVKRAEKLKHIAAAHLEKAEMFREAKQNAIDHFESKGELDSYKDAIESLDVQISQSMSRHQQAEEVFQNTMQILPSLVQEITSNVLTDERESAIDMDIESD
jgi:flagellar biosynthesis/type III secretory pathway protein FliH